MKTPGKSRHLDGQYTAADFFEVKKNALLWANILSQAPKKRLRKVVEKRLRASSQAGLWTQRLCATLCEIGSLVRDLDRTQKVPFVFACMAGDLSAIQKILLNHKLPNFIFHMPGVIGQDRHGRICFIAEKGASEHLVYLLMLIAQPARVINPAAELVNKLPALPDPIDWQPETQWSPITTE